MEYYFPPSPDATENLGAASVELTPDDLREIDKAAAEITVQGARSIGMATRRQQP